MSDRLQLVANLHNLTSIYTKTLAWRPEQIEVRDGKARQAEAYRTFLGPLKLHDSFNMVCLREHVET